MIRRNKLNVVWASTVVLGCMGAAVSACGHDPPPPRRVTSTPDPEQDPDVPVPNTAEPLPDGADIGGFPSAQKCESCHADIYAEWSFSMHAHAATSPVTIAQVNQVVAQEYKLEDDPDPQQFCTNCHGPIPTLITGQAMLPFRDSRYSDTALNEGITCSTCHKYDINEVPLIGYAAEAEFQKNFDAGPFMYGPFSAALDNASHESAKSSLLADSDDSDALCGSCHQVGLDLNGDGDLIVGEDFIVQNLFQEYLDYRAADGGENCVSCHMPARSGRAASVPGAPPRQIRSHIFLGVDYPLDEVAQGVDNLQVAREALLRGSAQVDIEHVVFADNTLQSFDVSIENTGTGHGIPSGFTFMRQMWVEVKVVDPTGQNVVFSSGVLDVPSNDLCDVNTIEDKGSLSVEVVGCDDAQDADDYLVNLQTKLVDKVDLVDGQVTAADGASEIWMQLLTGGVVNRVRPIDGAVLAPIKPAEKRTFSYPVGALDAVAGSKIKVRLLFRNLPPYMIRKLGKEQPSDEVQLRPLVQHLKITEIDTREFTLR